MLEKCDLYLFSGNTERKQMFQPTDLRDSVDVLLFLTQMLEACWACVTLTLELLV